MRVVLLRRVVALSAQGLSPAGLDTIADMIERVRQLEGLPNGAEDDG